MQKRNILFVVIILIIVAGYGFYLFNKPHRSVLNDKPSVTIAATELYAAYKKDEMQADKKYMDKIIAVKGIASEVQKTDSSFSVLINSGDSTGGINCSLSMPENKFTPVPSKGNMVIIKGRCAGFLMDVTLVDCVFEK